MSSGFSLLLTVGVLAAALAGCKPASGPNASSLPGSGDPSRPDAISVIRSDGAPAVVRSSAPPPAEIWKEFSGAKALEHARQQVELGPRPSGTPPLEKARLLIEDALRSAGWESERQTFTSETPRGSVQFSNIIARFSLTGKHPAPVDAQQFIVCSHYDTKRFSTIRFVGASDGASSTGALLEFARVLALDPARASHVELVFFDGEEAFVQYSETDGLYGSRYYAGSLNLKNRARQFKAGILWDMIGDTNLTVTLPPDSPRAVAQEVLAAADALGLRKNFGYFDRPILDDNDPLIHVARIPTLDLIDFDYPYWHTADDTLEHISADSLQKVGAVTLYYLRHAIGK